MQNPREAQAAREAQLRAQIEEAMAAARAAAQAAAEGTPRPTTRSQLAQGDRLQTMRDVLRRELADLENRRDEISSQLQNPMVGGANRRGLETRIEQIDARIGTLEGQIAQVEAAIAGASGTAVTIQPARPAPGPRPRAEDNPFVVIGALFMLCVALPLSIAYARRLWKRGSDAMSSIPADIASRLSRIEQNVDTVALEVERIGESQRFITRAFTERGLAPGAAEPVAVEREPGVQRRST